LKIFGTIRNSIKFKLVFVLLCSGLAESLFSSHREDYVEIEEASLTQLFQYKVFDSHCGSFLFVRVYERLCKRIWIKVFRVGIISVQSRRLPNILEKWSTAEVE